MSTRVRAGGERTRRSVDPGSRRRLLFPLAGAVAIAAVGAGLWLGLRPTGETGPVDCAAPPYRSTIRGAVNGDVELSTFGVTCTIKGIVTGDVIVRDPSDPCATGETITAVDIAGGTIRGNVLASGRECVMVFLEDGARVDGDVVYRARGNLGFLGDHVGAVVGGDVRLMGGHLWAHGESATNRIEGDLVCQGGQPKEGPGSGSASNWDGFQGDVDGTVGGTFGC